MLKKLFFALAMVIPMLAGAQTIKIGLVDTQAILASMPEVKTAQTNIEALAKKYDDQYQKMLKDAQAKLEEFQALPDDTPMPLREKLAKELQDFDQKLTEFQQMVQTELQKAQQQALAPIYQQLQNAVQAIGKEGGYTIIQDAASVMYFGAPAEDITPAVKTRLGIK